MLENRNLNARRMPSEQPRKPVGVSSRGPAIILCALLCTTWLTTTTRAQDTPAVIDDAQVLADLNDEDYTVRQAATRGLLVDTGLTQDDLDRLFVKSETPEQRHRILRVARHHDIRRMIDVRFQGQVGAGSMGLSHAVVQVPITEPDEQPTQPRAGIMAALTLPGFPAYATMDPGDVIIEFDGQPMPEKITGPLFQNMIQGRRAGQTINLKVVRNGVIEDIQMTLNYSQALGEAYHSSGVVLNSPYRDQWEQTRDAMWSLLEDEEQDAPDNADDAGP